MNRNTVVFPDPVLSQRSDYFSTHCRESQRAHWMASLQHIRSVIELRDAGRAVSCFDVVDGLPT